MTPHVVDADKCGDAIPWTEGFVGKVIRSIIVLGELVSRRNHCA